MGVSDQMNQTLTPTKTVNVEGKIHYNEGNQAWGKIKLKKEIINEFPQLKEKRSAFSYELMFCRTVEDLRIIIKKYAKSDCTVPLMLFLYKEKEEP